MKVKVTGLPGYDDFEGELKRSYDVPNKNKVLHLVVTEWEDDVEYVIVPDEYVEAVL